MDAAEQGVLEEKPEGFGDKELHVGAATVEVGTGALRGFFGGQDYLDSQINWASAGGMAGSTMKVAALAAAIKDGYSLDDTFDGNSPYLFPDGPDVKNQATADYGSSIRCSPRPRTPSTPPSSTCRSMADGPAEDHQWPRDLGIPPAKASKKTTASPAPRPAWTITASRSATRRSARSTWPTPTPPSPPAASGPTVHVVEKVVDASGEERYSWKNDSTRTIDEDIAADVSYALKESCSRHRHRAP